MKFQLHEMNGTEEIDLETAREMVASHGQADVQIEYASREEIREEYRDFLQEVPEIFKLSIK